MDVVMNATSFIGWIDFSLNAVELDPALKLVPVFRVPVTIGWKK